MPDYTLLIDIVMIGLLLATAITTIITRNLLISVIALSVFSLLMAVMYGLMGAPDVAMTEAAVGAGISTFLFLGALLLVGERESATPPLMHWLAFLVILPTLALLIYATTDMPPYGSAGAPAHQYVAPYYIEKVQSEVGIPNMVTAVLASYRAYDTLGEAMVVMTAALAVFLLLARSDKRRTTKNH